MSILVSRISKRTKNKKAYTYQDVFVLASMLDAADKNSGIAFGNAVLELRDLINKPFDPIKVLRAIDAILGEFEDTCDYNQVEYGWHETDEVAKIIFASDDELPLYISCSEDSKVLLDWRYKIQDPAIYNKYKKVWKKNLKKYVKEIYEFNNNRLEDKKATMALQILFD